MRKTIYKGPEVQELDPGHSGVSRVWQVGHGPWAPLEGGATEEALAPNVTIWERPKKDFLNHFLEVILQKPCNTHRHEYLDKLINNKCKT